MNKKIKYMGITIAALLAVSPIAVPDINSATEITVKAEEQRVPAATNNGSAINNGDGTYTLNGYVQALKDGAVIKIPLNGLKVTPSQYNHGAVMLDVPQFSGYKANTDKYKVMGIRDGYLDMGTNLIYTKTSETTNTNTSSSKEAPGYSTNKIFVVKTGTELYNDNVEKISNMSLGKDTAWKVDREQVVNGMTYFRVATNEWVKITNGWEIRLIDAVVKTSRSAAVYNDKGEKVSNRVLGANTLWKVDRKTDMDVGPVYRVATNEWILQDDTGAF